MLRENDGLNFVPDTNTLISGLLWNGAPARLLDAALRGHAKIFLSEELLHEFNIVLARPKFASRLAAHGESPDSLTLRFRNAAHIVFPGPFTPPANLRDKNDAIVLACA